MKTLDELYREVMADDSLKSEYIEAAGNGGAADFLKAHGCEATEQQQAKSAARSTRTAAPSLRYGTPASISAARNAASWAC